MKLKLLTVSIALLSMYSNAQLELLKDTNIGSGSGNPTAFRNYNGTLLFTANNTLWKSNGNTQSTSEVLINGENDLTDIGEIFDSFNNTNEIIVVGTNSFNGREIYKVNINNGTYSLVDDLIVGAANTNPRVFRQVNFNGIPKIIFQATNSSSSALYEFNRQTEVITQISGTSSTFNLFTGEIFNSDNSIVYRATGINGVEPHKYDGNSNTYYALGNLNSGSPNASSNPESFNEFNNFMYFSAFSGSGRFLFRTDGTEFNFPNDGITQVSNQPNVEDIFTYNNELFFTTRFQDDFWLFKTDGTQLNNETQVSFLTDSWNGARILNDPIIFNGIAYFTVADFPANDDTELFRTDGTSSGTQFIDIDPTTTTKANPKEFTELNGSLYFSARRSVTGRELFRITPSGTIALVANINPGNADSNPSNLFAYNNRIYFSADDGTHGNELWVHDPVTFTTNLVEDIQVGSGSANPKPEIAYNNKLYITATRGDIGTEVFSFNDATLSQNDFEISSNFKIYPVPTSESFQIKNLENFNKISLIDINGKLIKTFSEKMITYDISDLENGIYFVNINTENKGEILRLIKN